MKATFLSEKPLAWRLMVRRTVPPTTWALYSTYDSLKAANATVKAVAGYPLETKLIPLYPMLTNEDLK
jgi:hypothetical protein